MKLIELYERYLREASIDWKRAGATMDYDDPPKSLSGKGPSGKYEPPAKDDSSSKWEASDNDALKRLVDIKISNDNHCEFIPDNDFWGIIYDVFNGEINGEPDLNKLTQSHSISLVKLWNVILYDEDTTLSNQDYNLIDKFIKKIGV